MTAAKVSSVGATVGQVEEIPIEALFLSPLESRKTMDQAALKELSASIERDGILEPLTVRPHGIPNGHKLAEQHYEIVAGQRRYLASKLAGKPTCPCIVRKMTDAEALEWGIVSNLQREGLAPLQEAAGFRELLAAPGATVESIAAKLAKSPSYVGRRLGLLGAIAAVRDALEANAIEVGHALELARLSEMQQEHFLEQLNVGWQIPDTDGVVALDEDDFEDDPEDERDFDSDDEESDRPAGAMVWKPTPISVADLKRRITQRLLRVLSDAPFPLDDEIPPMACTACPKRSSNVALLFDDCAQDTCTDRACFDAKVKVWIKHELQKAADEKRKLVMITDGWSSIQGAIADYHVTIFKASDDECPNAEDAIWMDGEKAGRRARICKGGDCKKHGSGASASGGGSRSSLAKREDPEKTKAERKKLLARVKAEKAYREALFGAIAKAPVSVTAALDLNLDVCEYAIYRANTQNGDKVAEILGWPNGIFGWGSKKALREQLLKLKPPERQRVAMLIANATELVVSEHDLSRKAEDLEKLAGLLGVDAKKIRAASEPKADVKPVQPAKKAPAKKAPAKKKSILSSAAKKRIADAQKKRWSAAKKKAVRK
jgi:ParB family chromosome partitioning protein